MARKLVLLVLVVLSLLCAGCDVERSEVDGLTVENAIEYRNAVIEKGGPKCAFTFIDNDVQHRLKHYSICVAEEGDEEKAAEALLKAIQDCKSVCEQPSLDFTEAELDQCFSQCKGTE